MTPAEFKRCREALTGRRPTTGKGNTMTKRQIEKFRKDLRASGDRHLEPLASILTDDQIRALSRLVNERD